MTRKYTDDPASHVGCQFHACTRGTKTSRAVPLTFGGESLTICCCTKHELWLRELTGRVETEPYPNAVPDDRVAA